MNPIPKTYTFSNDRIKYCTFADDQFESSLYEPVTPESLRSDFTNAINSITQFLSTYETILTSNSNNFNTRAGELKRKTLSNYIIQQFIKRLLLALQHKLTSPPSQYELKSVQTVLSELRSGNSGINDLFTAQFPNESDVALFVESNVTPIHQHEQSVISSSAECGNIIISVTLKYIHFIYDKLVVQMNSFISTQQVNEQDNESQYIENEIALYELLLTLDHLEVVDLFVYNSYRLPKDDCFNISHEDATWKELAKYFVRVVPNNAKEVHDEIVLLNEEMSSNKALIANGFTSESNIMNLFSSGLIIIKNKLNPRKAVYQARRNDLIGDSESTMLKMCNLLKIGMIKKMIVATIPSIAFRKKLYLKRETKVINVTELEKILNELHKGNSTIEFNCKDDESRNTKPFYYERIQKEEKVNYVSTRLIHNSHITFANEKPPFSFLRFFSTTTNSATTNNTRNSLLIHIHGGGFIGTTTIAHENYLRRWVNQLGIPIIGIDYSLAPQNKYPSAVNDVWQAYMWIINHAENCFGIKINNIIISGDSAGGNLVLSLVFMLIVHGVRLPDLILAEYPACDTSIYNMSPSMLLCLTDGLLKVNFLKYINMAYRNNYEREDDPFLNPETVSNDVLKKVPRIRFFLGSFDPLRDGAVRLAYKMAQVGNVDLKVYEFKEYVHGFLGMGSENFRNLPTAFLIREIDELIKERESNGKGSG